MATQSIGLTAETTGYRIFIICLYLVVLGFRCCARAFSGCSEQELLVAVASLAVKHRL